MIRITQIKVPPGQENRLISYVAKTISVTADEIKTMEIVKCSLDARKKPDLFWIYTVDVQLKKHVNLKKIRQNKNVTIVSQLPKYEIPSCGRIPLKNRPVVVGMGPAGLFCAYLLAQKGFRPVLIERGHDVDTRRKDVEAFWQGMKLNVNSNVQFGEGGAGTFSDGKLNTGVKDKEGRNRAVLEILCKHGAREEILYSGKPHIGTDVLANVVKSMREEICSLGGSVLFAHKFVGYKTAKCDGTECTSGIKENDKTGREFIKEITVENLKSGEKINIETEALILAIGHSARDTYTMLYESDMEMEQKPFAIGVRVEHLQDYINATQYGEEYQKRYPNLLPASSYKLTARAKDGRGVYSFCMCPGGYIVNASSEEGHLAVNGMSYSGRNGMHADSAIVVTVDSKDYGTGHCLAGMHFQRELEEKAYRLGEGKIPVQYYEDFKTQVKEAPMDANANKVREEKDLHSLKGEYSFANVNEIFSKEIASAIVDGMEQFNDMIPGFAEENPLLCGVESRTSAPIRIVRDEKYQTKVRGIYPCGEGAGYAGGITSAAMDGMKVAESLISQYCPQD